MYMPGLAYLNRTPGKGIQELVKEKMTISATIAARTPISMPVLDFFNEVPPRKAGSRRAPVHDYSFRGKKSAAAFPPAGLQGKTIVYSISEKRLNSL